MQREQISMDSEQGGQAKSSDEAKTSGQNSGDGDRLSNAVPSKPEVQKTRDVIHNYPTSSRKGPKDWDAIERQVMKEEEEESLEGDAAVNKMFQKIYRDADDDVKRAMIKSYSESGGTCLSTDWKDISKKKTKVKPPEGMEFKKWD